MEVNKIKRTEMSNVQKKKQVATESVSFSDVVSKKRENLVHEKLMLLQADIEDQGKNLAQSRTIEDLKKYKRLVKSFMEEAVNNGLKLEEQRGFFRHGRTKVYKLVKEVDQKLIDLTNEVLDKEKKGLDILGLVGEIQGLLINIYT
ncbi:YaaR family protein [Cytobacillus dafuensis]|uniref:DUF327 family protein n=1 Tax=Cytobacillus dafuensis TaxID=1742359 RepID=A0A5B8ZBH0_CYTDA|nr:YaaR family protein [Cytobacillus dafuensis]QED49603.1 DUF327 family protein [Cytobacillus dafuensis]